VIIEPEVWLGKKS